MKIDKQFNRLSILLFTVDSVSNDEGYPYRTEAHIIVMKGLQITNYTFPEVTLLELSKKEKYRTTGNNGEIITGHIKT